MGKGAEYNYLLKHSDCSLLSVTCDTGKSQVTAQQKSDHSWLSDPGNE